MECKNCGTTLVPAKSRSGLGGKTFCNNKCQQEFQIKTRTEKFLNGEFAGQLLQFRTGEWTRRLLANHFGYSCSCCGIAKWNEKEIVLEVNHKDGDATNNVMSNLEFLCPNCHSQTETFRAKNKNSTRTFRKKKNS